MNTIEKIGTSAKQDSLVRALLDLREVVQRVRIQFGNRLSAMDEGRDQDTYRYVIHNWAEVFEQLEVELNGALTDLADDMPIVAYMTRVKGIGPILALRVAGMIDIHKADTISALWRYAGYGVVDGRAEKPKKGERLHYNKRLKTACYIIGFYLLRFNPQYRQIYDKAKERYGESYPDWTPKHKHLAAMRVMIKLWLSHLWIIWRSIEGLPVREPYILGNNGHHNLISPQEMGWPEL